MDLDQYRQNATFTKIKGQQIAYWQGGKGEVLLLIHGFPSAAWDWHALWPHLTKRYHVIALDMLGFGLSDKPHPHRYSIIEQRDIVAELLAYLSVDQYHILAHDYGDSVAQALLASSLENSPGQGQSAIQSVAFLNGGLFSESHRPLLTQKLLKGPFGPLLSRLLGQNSLRRSFGKIFGRQTPPKEQDIQALWQLLQHNRGTRVLPAILSYIDERAFHRDTWVAAMEKTTVPLCFINGIQDPISGQHMLSQFQTLLPNALSVPLNCGHYPQLELPQEVLRHYFAFRHGT